MSTVTVQLPPDTERKLRGRAEQLGQTLESYLQQLAEKAVECGTLSVPGQRESIRTTPVRGESEDFPKFISRPKLSADEVEHLLDELASGSPGEVLPPDFCRADIYDDHD
jgi:hypothetical protein